MSYTKTGHQSNKILFLVVFNILIWGCANRERDINVKDVQRLKIAYLPKDINPNMAISNCNAIFEYPKELLKDTVITDLEFIVSFIKGVNELKASNDIVNYDFRIKCLIILKQDENKEICFGEDQLTVFDNALMVDNSKLFDLLNSALYKQ